MIFLTEEKARKRIEESPLRQLLNRMSEEKCPMLRGLEKVVSESKEEQAQTISKIGISVGSEIELKDGLGNN